MDRLDSTLLLALLLAGAVIGFSLTGTAALGTLVAAGVALVVMAMHHRKEQRRTVR
jgi:hypothetical protein